MKLDPADIAFSLYIRTRDNWTCQRCGKKYQEGDKGLACSHFYGRVNESTRFSPENCIACCFGCHKYFDETNREAYRDFKINQLGENGFKILTLQRATYKRKDRKMEAIIWKKAYEDLLKSIKIY